MGTKFFDLGSFRQGIENNIVIFEISAPECASLQNFAKIQKYLNLGPKMPYSVSLGRTLRKPLPYLKSAPSNLCNYKILWRSKNVKLGNKNALFGYFSASILKYYYHSRNQHLKFLIHGCLIHTVNFGIRFTFS